MFFGARNFREIGQSASARNPGQDRKMKFSISAEDLSLNRSKLLLCMRRVAAFRLIFSRNIGNYIFPISGHFGLFQSEVDTRLFVGVGKVYFRRIESLVSRPRTGQKEHNIEFQSGSVVYFGVPICENI